MASGKNIGLTLAAEKTRLGKNAQFTTLYKNNAKTCLESKFRAYLQRLIFLRKIIAGNRRTVFIRDVVKNAADKQNAEKNKNGLKKTDFQNTIFGRKEKLSLKDKFRRTTYSKRLLKAAKNIIYNT